MSDFIIIGDRIERKSNVNSVFIRPVKGSSSFDIVAKMIYGAEIKQGNYRSGEDARQELRKIKTWLNV